MRPLAVYIVVIAIIVGLVAVDGVNGLKIVVRYPEKNAQRQIMLRGNGCGLSWDRGVPTARVSQDTFEAKLTCDGSVGIPEFKPLLGDEWSKGGNYKVDVSSSGKRQGTVEVFPWFVRNRGAYHVINNVWSPELRNSRDVVVYLPPSYFENGLRKWYPTLVAHDGQNLFNSSTAFGGVAWECHNTLDAQILSGKMEEIVVVGPYNTADRMSEYTYSVDPQYGGGRGDIYLNFVRDTLLPKMKAEKIPIASDAAHRAILGSSLGGLISCYALWSRPSEYFAAGCMSSSFWWNSQDFSNTIIPKHQAPLQRTFYLDSGDSGTNQDHMLATITVRDHMLQKGFSYNKNLFYYLDRGASHNELYWGKRFWAPMQSLFPPAIIIPL